MDFFFPQKVKLGQGVSLNVGFAAKEEGARALLTTEGAWEDSKELSIVSQALDRASVPYILLTKNATQAADRFIEEAASVIRASRADVVVTLGGNSLLSLGRTAVWRSQAQKPPALIEVPVSVCFPLLLRREAFVGSGHPSDLRFEPLPEGWRHRIFLDPHMATGQTPASSISSLLETLFFAVEAFYQDSCGLTEESLLLGAIEELWQRMAKIYESPANVENRHAAVQAGFNIALALGLMPRGAGLTLAFVLGSLLETAPTAFGSLFLAPFLEQLAGRSPEKTQRLARAFQAEQWDGPASALGPKLAQDVRKFLNTYKLPLRLADYGIVDTQIILAADVVRSMKLGRSSLLDSDSLEAFLRQIL